MTAVDPHDGAGRGTPAAPDRPVEELVVTPADDVSPTLSIVLPTKNEAAGINECLDRIERAITTLGVPTEIIVSDSSTDRTPEIARARGATVVVSDRPGYGAAYRRAFEVARGEFIVMGDADTTYDFAAIPHLVEHLVATDADLVLGSRLAGEIEPGAMPWLHRYIGNPLLTRFLNTFYGTEVSDAHSGFRVVTRAALETLELETDGMEFASEMIMKAGARGLAIEEVPITYHEREGEATLESFRDGWRHVRFMLTNAPGYLFSVPGLGLGILGLIFMGLVAAGAPVGGITLGVRSMIAGGVLVLVGYQIMSFAVFSTVATDPIQQPSDPLTRWLNRALTIRRGGAGGCVVFAGGSLYALALLHRWLTAGYAALPVVTSDIAALVAIALGVQTVFTSFLAEMLREYRPARTRAGAQSATETDGHDPAAGD
ncbi:glycosyl transferase family 2 [Natrinema pellirubrum DSM 15624]|uniref:Glycosyl transferase n=1 Tax=Natrinema pellirubrum (strain DSM 15624 / CIP 106293 / JCM 10476 / NCIMB 786 / 157) TaxID=797303 RepID=L0JQD9_NATP1|nr:glycosyltransferase family 2 protein [Natrinema pellirubrum]AGB33740.1 glycosyl transferase [Natrinema pellirubrum DSM 15624]ELY76277.1 glycosyl transferase family 2 [Natrinema pellirubrum DSM 15624]